MYILQCCGFISGSRPGSTDGDGFPLPAVHHHPHHHQPDHLGRLLHHPSAGGPLDAAQHSQPGRQHTALTGLNLPGAQFHQHLVGGPPGMTAAQEMGLPCKTTSVKNFYIYQVFCANDPIVVTVKGTKSEC